MDQNKDLNMHIGAHGKVEQETVSEKAAIKRMNLEAGLLGRIFGGKENAPINICSFIGLVIVVTFTVIVFVPTRMEPAVYWKSTEGLLLTLIGYFIGKSK